MNARRLILLPFLSVVLLAGKLHAESLQAVADLMNRIDTSRTLATKVETRLDTSHGAREHFIICPPEAKGGSALIKGNTISALTTGLNWYLNHYAHINLSWNHLTTDMSKARLPKVTATERHDAGSSWNGTGHIASNGQKRTQRRAKCHSKKVSQATAIRLSQREMPASLPNGSSVLT